MAGSSLLHRMSGAVRRQDWFQVLLELLIVVFGILIALQVDNWNEQRKAREQAAIWKQQLVADLRQNIVDLEGRTAYAEQALAFGETALAGLQAPEEPTGDAAWDTVLGAFQAGQIWPYRLNGATFREVQNAGGLDLLGDQRAQVALSYLYDVSANDFEVVSGGTPAYRLAIRERLDWDLQRHIWDSDCQLNIPRGNLGQDDLGYALTRCDPPDDPARIARALRQLRGDSELQNLLRGRLSQLKISAASTRRLVLRARMAIGLLEAPRS